MNQPKRIRPFKAPIYNTRPFLPPIDEYIRGIEEIWNNKWLTNNGPILQRFSKEMTSFLGTENVSMLNNGTLALQIGLQCLRVSGEVITTPFSFVATTHALHWNKIRPVFCDVEPVHYTLDPEKTEAAITPWTTAILAVHVFGYPCQLNALSDIARRHNLLLIYDAAHAFGVSVNGKSIAEFGDLNMFSFHATKLFHSIEGGMLVFKNRSLKTEIDYLKNFGFRNETEVVMPGTNAKMNEMQALMGLTMLKYVPQLIDKRKAIFDRYRKLLGNVLGIDLPPEPENEVDYNYAYFPIQIDERKFGLGRDQLYASLKEYNVYCRRYFYPLICDFACYRNVPKTDALKTARRVAERILNLPIYYDLELHQVDRICEIIKYLQTRC